MRHDVHASALRAAAAAAKVALSITVLNGCGGAQSVGEDGASTPYGEPGTLESDVTGAPKTKKPGSSKKSNAAATAPCHQDASAPPKQSCEAVVAAAFPVEGDYPGEAKDGLSAEVKTCCVELLLSTSGMMPHRWDCCGNVEREGDVGMACTPWGPPVPPAMKARRERLVA